MGGGVGTTNGQPPPTPSPPDQVWTSTPSPPGPGLNIYPLPPPLGPGLNIYPLPPDQVWTSTPSPPGTRSEHLSGWDQVTTPPPPPRMRPGYNTPPPRTMHRRAVRILLECILVCLHVATPPSARANVLTKCDILSMVKVYRSNCASPFDDKHTKLAIFALLPTLISHTLTDSFFIYTM